MFQIVKVSELSGSALNWAVAKCEGIINGDVLDVGFILEGGYSPSTDWAQGGPIIEREGISVDRMSGAWTADISDSVGVYIEQTDSGPTPLIAAMRCYVASKLGDTVEVPAELLEAV
jgi:hypothetical protein